MKEERAEVLWQAVERCIPDVRKRVEFSIIGSPLAHEAFLRRDRRSRHMCRQPMSEAKENGHLDDQ